jgi:predicted nucleic-acid-binding protein
MRKIVVDTNVLVRILIREDSDQGRVADALLSSAMLVVPTTVLLESQWVMKSIMKIERPRIIEMLRSMLRLSAIEVENRAAVTVAVNAHAAGLDFADALHVACTKDVDAFLTFDKSLARRAGEHFHHVSIELAS